MQTVLESPKPLSRQNRPLNRAYKRRVYEVRSPCQWLNHCYGGKCPNFVCVKGNFYCAKEGIP